MGRLIPVSRGDMITRMKNLGFEGPYTGGRHQFMLKGHKRIILPNPHRGFISVDLLSRILKQMGISRNMWLDS